MSFDEDVTLRNIDKEKAWMRLNRVCLKMDDQGKAIESPLHGDKVARGERHAAWTLNIMVEHKTILEAHSKMIRMKHIATIRI